jgi:hypothetical protein
MELPFTVESAPRSYASREVGGGDDLREKVASFFRNSKGAALKIDYMLDLLPENHFHGNVRKALHGIVFTI